MVVTLSATQRVVAVHRWRADHRPCPHSRTSLSFLRLVEASSRWNISCWVVACRRGNVSAAEDLGKTVGGKSAVDTCASHGAAAAAWSGCIVCQQRGGIDPLSTSWN
jgi:hypothetical protein